MKLMFFVGDIQVMALINTGAQLSTITEDFCDKHRYEIHPMKQILCLEEMGGSPFHTWGIQTLLLKSLQSKIMVSVFQCLSLSLLPLIFWESPSNLALLCWIGLWPGSPWKSWLMSVTLGDKPSWAQWSLLKWLAQSKLKTIAFPSLTPLWLLLNPSWFLSSDANE